jgi:hypothetical protein
VGFLLTPLRSPRCSCVSSMGVATEPSTATLARPRTNRTTATKVSASLISKIENNESGCDLKITSLIPFDHLAQLCHALAKNESTERLDLEGCGRTWHATALARLEDARLEQRAQACTSVVSATVS